MKTPELKFGKLRVRLLSPRARAAFLPLKPNRKTNVKKKSSKKPVPSAKTPVATEGPRVLSRAELRSWAPLPPGKEPRIFPGGILPGSKPPRRVPGRLEQLRGVPLDKIGAFVVSLLHIMERVDISAAFLGKEGGPEWKLLQRAARRAGLTLDLSFLCGLLAPALCLFPHGQSCAALMLRGFSDAAESKWKLPPGWDAYAPWLLERALWGMDIGGALPPPLPCARCERRKASDAKRRTAKKAGKAAGKASGKAAGKGGKSGLFKVPAHWGKPFETPAEALERIVKGKPRRRR